jgi:hypothetical protein
MDLKQLKKPLTIDDIDFRVQSVNKGGYATILAYKDARVDMNRLDEVIGQGMWQRDHKEIKGVIYCGIGIWFEGALIWKWDAGAESMAEKQKGEASDSFKRAGFNWGIGRELYDYPVISIKLLANEFDKTTKKPTWDFKLKQWVWFSQFTDGKLTYLACKDDKGNKRFEFGNYIKNK